MPLTTQQLAQRLDKFEAETVARLDELARTDEVLAKEMHDFMRDRQSNPRGGVPPARPISTAQKAARRQNAAKARAVKARKSRRR